MKEKPTPLEFTPQDIYDRLDQCVIGQERAKRTVAIAAYSHIKRITHPRLRESRIVKKSNILMVGPTGSGKTHIARNLADILHLPFTVVDATEYTEAGYYGKDVEVMAGELLHRAQGNAELAQMGIIFIDEIDKIARRADAARTGAGGKDIGGEGVQHSLLRMLEGQKMFVPLNVTQHWNKHDFVEIDTSDILFICAGTFSDLRQRKETPPTGFNRPEPTNRPRKITHEELQKNGLIPELLGRLPVIVRLEELTDDELLQVLTVPPDALVNQYRELMAADDVTLHFDDAALKRIVGISRRRKVGARGLRGIMEDVMHDYLFHAPHYRGQTVTITEDDVARAEEEGD